MQICIAGRLMFEWGDLRYFLAVEREGSTLAAAQALRVSQSTVTRRLAALEEGLQLKLFDRLQTGSRLTDQGEALHEAALEVERSMVAFGELAALNRRTLTGTIRFTLPTEGVNLILGAPLTAFLKRHPGVKVELLSTGAMLDIAAGEADVALRAGPPPAHPDLIVRKVGDHYWAFYCSHAYAEAHGLPDGLASLRDHAVIGAEGQLAGVQPMRWLEAQFEHFVCRGSSIETLIGLARTGMGVALLPIGMPEPYGDMVRCTPPVDGLHVPINIITRDDIRRTPHGRAFIDFISAHVAALIRSESPEPAQRQASTSA